MRPISTSLRFQGSVIELRNVVQGSTQVKFGADNVTKSLPCFAQRVLAFYHTGSGTSQHLLCNR